MALTRLANAAAQLVYAHRQVDKEREINRDNHN
jgi:hypothetical protein